jgi:hypothetical protein
MSGARHVSHSTRLRVEEDMRTPASICGFCGELTFPGARCPGTPHVELP